MATNIEVNGKKYFRLQKTVGYRSGKPIRKSFYGTSERDARNKYEAWIEEQVRAEYEKRIADETTTFGMRAQQYVEDVLRVSQKYSTGTKYRYERSYKVYVKDRWSAGPRCPKSPNLTRPLLRRRCRPGRTWHSTAPELLFSARKLSSQVSISMFASTPTV